VTLLHVERVPACLDVSCCENGPAIEELLRASCESSIAWGDAADGVSPCIMLFDRAPSCVVDRVKELSRRGERRLIAIATNDGVLDGPAAWALLRAGASDAFGWGEGACPWERVARRIERWSIVDDLAQKAAGSRGIVGHAGSFRSTIRQLVEVARFSDASVLITGETGTGKELAARLIHDLDSRQKKGNFVVVDCTNIVPELSGSEFFGHDRGAFTGASSARDGAIALADGGTLFLDEVGDLPLPLQAELLRVLQERTYKRVGSNVWHSVQFRLVCATHRDLYDEQGRGRFRSDLYYRLSDWTFRLPALRERVEDVIPLMEHFLRVFLHGRADPELDRGVREHLLSRPFPGNIRELRQLAFRVACRFVGPGPVTVGDLGPEEIASRDDDSTWDGTPFVQVIQRALAAGAPLKEIGKAAEDTAVRLAVTGEDGNLQRAARKLGVTDRALQMRRASQRPGP
jgi:transcriptional regulator with GAF, ATPase, and Fis domain